MQKIDTKYLLEKGLEQVREIESFEVEGNHYYPYDNVFKELYSTHNVETEFRGSSDQGVAISKFTKKLSDQKRREEKQNLIRQFEKANNIKILRWE